MQHVKTYSATLQDHQVSLEFDQKMLVLNRARLSVDGEKVDEVNVFYGDKELTHSLADGTEVVVRLHSGMMGELNRPQLRGADGSWVDLVEG